MTYYSDWFGTVFLVVIAAIIIGIIITISELRKDKSLDNKSLDNNPLAIINGFVPLIIALSIGSLIINTAAYNSKLTTLVNKIDEELSLRRFWMIGKAYQKVIEA